jgi:hypothetical protein
MRERPILFSAPMVRAILDGRKTQTRRVIKPQPTMKGRWMEWCHKGVLITEQNVAWHPFAEGFPRALATPGLGYLCPYGRAGDRLWVKERWRPYVAHSCALDACDCGDVEIEYRADGEKRYFHDATINEASPDWTLPKAADRGDVTPLFMPRWASRLTLEVTGVRVERLQDISEADVLAEGFITREGAAAFNYDGTREYFIPEQLESDPTGPVAAGGNVSARQAFRRLFESINGAGSWDANPWVWVVAFRRVEATRG